MALDLEYYYCTSCGFVREVAQNASFFLALDEGGDE
jgi:hypothetical protein